jgi:hypothetical protein
LAPRAEVPGTNNFNALRWLTALKAVFVIKKYSSVLANPICPDSGVPAYSPQKQRPKKLPGSCNGRPGKKEFNMDVLDRPESARKADAARQKLRDRRAEIIRSLQHGRSRKCLVRVVRDEQTPLYRIAWPDIGLSAAANLSRCCDAAERWAAQKFLTDNRKMNAARALKSLNNFSWLASPVRLQGEAALHP